MISFANDSPDISKSSHPFVSIIIPVFNDAERLGICLQNLENQTYPKDRYEVIVIDNGSKESIDKFVKQFLHAVVYHEPHRSSYAARNKGISLARGEILAFTDSDCVPAIDWIQTGTMIFLKDPDIYVIGGPVEFFFRTPEKPSAIELFDSLTAFKQKTNIEQFKFSVTANLFTFKKIFHHVGVFNTNLKSGGDYEWGLRATLLGYPPIYAAGVRVAHPARRSFKQLLNKYLRVIGGQYDMKKNTDYPFTAFARDLLKDFLNLIMSIRNRLFDDELTFKQRYQVIFIMSAIRCLQIGERIRLRLGGESRQ